MRPPIADRGVIWDMDGVLVDTAEAHYQAWRQTLKAYGILFDRQTFSRVFGMNNFDTLTQLLGRQPTEREFSEIATQKEKLFRDRVEKDVRLLPGAKRLLGELAQDGWLQAIASSAPQENIDLMVDLFSLRLYFAVILSGAGLPAGKPDPSLFLAAARCLGLPPSRCVVVEDAPVGVQAAARAGMPCIAIATTRPASLLGGGMVFPDLSSVTLAAFHEALWHGLQQAASQLIGGS